MDEKSQKLFDETVKREPQELTEEAARFLYGRRDYMTSDQKERFEPAFKKIEKLNAAKAAKEAKEVVEEEQPFLTEKETKAKSKKN